MKFSPETESENGNMSPQLPSLVDVVFILLLFFLILSVLSFGVVKTGATSEDAYEKEQDLSEFPAVPKALHKEMKESLILSLGVDDFGVFQYYVFSNMPYAGLTIRTRQEYEAIRGKLVNGQLELNGATTERPLTLLEATWGPFSDAESMGRSRLAAMLKNADLVIQANEKFTYHQVLQVMRSFPGFKSIYFEVIENNTNS